LRALVKRWTWDGGPEAVNQQAVNLLDCQGRPLSPESFLPPRTCCSGNSSRKSDQSFVKKVFAKIGAEAEHLPNDFVRDVMAQVDQRE
jgi:hypothetical protein